MHWCNKDLPESSQTWEAAMADEWSLANSPCEWVPSEALAEERGTRRHIVTKVYYFIMINMYTFVTISLRVPHRRYFSPPPSAPTHRNCSLGSTHSSITLSFAAKSPREVFVAPVHSRLPPRSASLALRKLQAHG